MKYDGKTGQTPGDLLQNVESQLRLGAGFEFIGPVGGANGNRQGVTAGTLYKFLDILGTGIGGVSSRDVDIVLDAGQGAQFRFHHNAVVMGILYDLFGHSDILLK